MIAAQRCEPLHGAQLRSAELTGAARKEWLTREVSDRPDLLAHAGGNAGQIDHAAGGGFHSEQLPT